MEKIHIDISKDLLAFLHAESAARGCATTSECALALLKEVQRCATEEKLEASLLEGLQGKATIVDSTWWRTFRARQVKRRKSTEAS